MFPEYINIINEEVIYKASSLPTVIICVIAILCLTFVLIYLYIFKNPDISIKLMGIAISVFIPLFLISTALCGTVFKKPCGTEYTASIDKSKITVEQYEQFLEEYRPIYDKGVYTWKVYEDK